MEPGFFVSGEFAQQVVQVLLHGKDKGALSIGPVDIGFDLLDMHPHRHLVAGGICNGSHLIARIAAEVNDEQQLILEAIQLTVERNGEKITIGLEDDASVLLCWCL